jgi:N-acetylglucosaminyldiphosphoundecaprenol N-acetyl-beta-D-mannosaminyltransferase
MTDTEQKQDKLNLLHVAVDRVDYDSALARINKLLDTNGCKQVVTLNPEYVMRAEKEPQLQRIINGAELTVPDGMGIVWASRLLGEPLPDRVTGTGLLPKICKICADEGLGIFLLGGGPGVAKSAATELLGRYPQLNIAGISSSDPDASLDDALVEQINSSGATVLAVAYGCPKQDLWIDRNRKRLSGVRVAIGVGGAFDFISGQIPRAPRFMRRTGTEWLFRLWIEPSRGRRMMALPRFGWKVLRSRKRV